MRALLLFVIGVFFGLGGGVVLSASQNWTLSGHDHGDPAQHGGSEHMSHDVPVAVSGAAPAVSVAAEPDPMGGYNLHLETQNFAFAPEAVNGEHVAGEGHAHVYIDGVKLGRFYAPWIHIPHGGEVRLTLNANDHRVLAVDGDPVEKILTLD